MSTLLIRLAGPLQSWGTESKLEIRRTEREPTKSGMVGLLASALGRRRDEDVSDLCGLRFGVRIDREGELLQDYHIAWKKNEKHPYVTIRNYLCDAVFLAGFESGNKEILQELDYALHHPAFPLFLGRRSCPPTQPLSLGIREKGLEEALNEEEWQVSGFLRGGNSQSETASLRMVIDAKEGETSVVEKDIPISYNPRHRQYGYRALTEKNSVTVKITGSNVTEHDPMKELKQEAKDVPDKDGAECK